MPACDADLFPPMTPEAMARRGWDAVDVLLISGDAYVDHPAFGVALLARWLEAHGLRVGVVARPDWRSPGDVARLGRPRLMAGVTAGAVDSMIANYTAARRLRRDDHYAPGGAAGGRPNRACLIYANLVQRAFPGLPVVLGGLEASLRRFAHYDYWSDSVRRSLLVDSKAALLVHGMAERTLQEIADRLRRGQALAGLRGTAEMVRPADLPAGAVQLPSFDEVRGDKRAYMRAAIEIERQANPCCGAPLAQAHGDRFVLVHPPAEPLTSAELDAVYDQPFTRRVHPDHAAPVPALVPVEWSITVVRGCFGGCAFCALGAHQGKVIQSRGEASVVAEARRLAAMPGFRGTITDLGGPTANMYGLGCRHAEAARRCRRPSCLFPEVCPNLETDHGAQLRLLAAVAAVPGVRHVFIGSGVRHDLALLDPRYIDALAAGHVSGQLKVAPEHADPEVLRLMRKPPFERYDEFQRRFEAASRRAGRRQYLLPYFIAGHPGSSPAAAARLRDELARRGLRVDQAQEFIPAPLTMATAQYYTGLDPETLEPIPVPRADGERRAEKDIVVGPGRADGGPSRRAPDAGRRRRKDRP